MHTWREDIIFEDCWTASVSTGTVSCHCNEAILVAFSSSNSELARVFPDFLDLIKTADIAQSVFFFFQLVPVVGNMIRLVLKKSKVAV